MRRSAILGVVLSVWLAAFHPAIAAVSRIEIRSREPHAMGRSFEGVGPYQTLRGKVFFAVDPAAKANQQVIDLELAPKNEKGLVEFSADVEILAPVDLAKASGSLLYDVNNRGNKLALGQFNSGADEFLMRNGYIVVWSGWIAETLPGGGRLRLTAPVATDNGSPITGPVRAEVVVDSPADRWNLGQWANQGSYEPTERGEKEAVLTWRQREADPRVAIPRDQWHFEKKHVEADGDRGQLPQIDLVVHGGLQPGYIYEVVYEARGPVVQGLGLAGIRDLISCLKNDVTDRNPLRLASGQPAPKYAYGFGVSQSGRCLRMFLYDGFNADEQGRKVFDGLMPHVAGAGLGFFNHRFASPTRHNAQHDNHLYPADMFPFAFGDDRDPLSGREDGILRKARASNTVPKVMQTQSSSEYWQRSASLVHTDPLGEHDVDLPPEVRLYCFGGTQHGAGSGTPASAPSHGQLISNPADYRPLVRALLTALDAWVRNGTSPPPSVYPRIADGTLIGWQQKESGWHALPSVRYPDVIQCPPFVDRGPEFQRYRRTSIEPPKQLGSYVVKVPAYGPDDNELGTLQIPAVAVPVATYTSWNLRNRASGAENEIFSLNGGYIPFVKTVADQKKSGDPRPALLERYRNFDDYLEKVKAAANKMVQQRYLLADELPALEAAAKKNRPLFE